MQLFLFSGEIGGVDYILYYHKLTVGVEWKYILE